MHNAGGDSARSGLLIVVAAALVNAAGEVLVQQRPTGRSHGGLWEFPGGKVEPRETPEDALVRELAEELEIAVEASALVPAGFATDASRGRPLLLLLYVARRWTGELRPTAAEAIAWHRPAVLRDLPMLPADAPLVATLGRLI